MRKPNIKMLTLEVENWNLKFSVGTPVTVRLDSGEIKTTTTRSEAQVLSGHSAVIWLTGISGCYLLDRVSAIQSTPCQGCGSPTLTGCACG